VETNPDRMTNVQVRSHSDSSACPEMGPNGSGIHSQVPM